MIFLSRRAARHLLLSLALCCAARAASCAAPPRVLVLMSGTTMAPWSQQLGEALRGELLRRHPSAELHLEVLQHGADPRAALPRWLAEKYAGETYAALVPLTSDQLPVALALRERLWPMAAVVAPELDASQAAALARMPRLTGLLKQDPVARNLALMFALAPATRHVAVISTGLDRDPIRPAWRAALQPWLQRATLIDLSGLAQDELARRVSRLPAGTALYFAAPNTSRKAAVMTPYDTLRALTPLTRAPILVDAGTLLGTGAIGGWVHSPAAHARDVASQLDRLLAGTPPERIGFEPHSAPRLQFDWRALQRSGIDSARLPAGSELRFQPPGIWESHRGAVLATALALLLQSGLIVALLLERRRRKGAERRARQHLGELARLDRIGAVGALSAALAHEINQPLGAILSNAETAELLLDLPAPPHQELRDVIAAIRDDNGRAAAVLVRLRAWIANSAGERQRLSLNPLLLDVARILRMEVQMRETELRLQLDDMVPDVVADGVQIQQVTLNLVLNALDALQQVAPGQRRIVIRSSRNGAGGADVCIADNGPGLADVAAQRLFEPFFSTKPDGLGVGLSISRSILERHGGTLRAELPAGGGAVFRFSLPCAEAAPA